MESQNKYIMKKADNQSTEASAEEAVKEVQETVTEAPKQLDVPTYTKVDVNKVIEERRKVIESGKQVNK